MTEDPERKVRFAECLRASQSRLLGYIHSLVRDQNDADDLFQQTAMVLWNKFDDFDPARSFGAWACGVARLEVSNFVRSRSRKKLYLSDDLSLLLIEAYDAGPDERQDEDERAALGRCVDKLRERDRALLLTYYAGERGVTEVADGLGRSSQSVHNSLKRIREALYECVRRTLAQDAHARRTAGTG